jgi:predicted dinucleotide-binding enzyme
MRIACIGTGNIGGNLARRFAALGHDVTIANSRGPDTLAGLASETGATPLPVEEVARDAEVVIVAIPMKAVPELPAGVLDATAPGAPVVDTGNYYPTRDGTIQAIEDGMLESGWVGQELGRPVIKAFNVVPAQRLIDGGKPRGTPGRLGTPVAGDDEGAKAVVMRLIDELGFDPVDAGGIADSWRQEPGTPGYGKDLTAAEFRRALDAAQRKG